MKFTHVMYGQAVALWGKVCPVLVNFLSAYINFLSAYIFYMYIWAAAQENLTMLRVNNKGADQHRNICASAQSEIQKSTNVNHSLDRI